MGKIFDMLARSSVRSPYLWLLASVLVGSLAFPLVAQLKVNSNWTAMLPRDAQSVRDLELTRSRVGGLNELSVALFSKDSNALTSFARALVPRLEKLKKTQRIFAVEWNVAEYEDFVYAHRHLYADLTDLQEIRDELQLRLDYERLKHNPLYVNLEEPPESPEVLIDRMQKKSEEGKKKLARYPGGFYLHPDGDMLVVFVRTDLGGGDSEGTARLVEAIEREVKALEPHKYAKDLTVEYAGSLMAGLEEQRAIVTELLWSTTLTSVIVLLAILGFFRRFRAPALLWVGVSIPTLVTFAFARLTVGELNTSTAFLGSIVLGNGVNPHIIWLARYFEERRRGIAVPEAVLETNRATWLSTLAVAATAALAYGSLVLTDFRGFRDFGVIAAAGMFICWAGVYTILPAVTVLAERLRPLRFKTVSVPGTLYGRLFFRIVSTAPRTVVAVAALVSVVSAVLVTQFVIADPIEYDFRKLKSVREESSRVSTINGRIGEILPSSGEGNAVAMLVSDRSHTVPLKAALEDARDHHKAPFGGVRSIDDLLPKEQPAKIPVLGEIRALLQDARAYAKDDEVKKIDEHIPPADLKELGPNDLPEPVARRFTERDGVRGRMLFITNQTTMPDGSKGPSVWDGRYLISWAKALRAVRLPDGARPPLAGRAPVFADMVEAVLRDGPIAVLASLSITALLVSLAFRRMRDRFTTLGTLLIGVLWMTGVMAAAQIKLNFLNFVAFPITFGNGADYGINVMQRYVQEREEPTGPTLPGETPSQRAIRMSVQESGGAVILCSLTTVVGYTSLFVSANLALRSFGAAMAISELSCLTTAVLALPALLWLRGRARSAA